MEIGMAGLGRMGGNMAERLVRGGHRVWVWDRTPAVAEAFAAKGASWADTLPHLAQSLARPRAVWIMVPAGAPVDQSIEALVPHLEKGDTIIDGGNSNYKDSQRRAGALLQRGFEF